MVGGGALSLGLETAFHGADGADALQAISQQWTSVLATIVDGRLGGLRSLVAVAGPQIREYNGDGISGDILRTN
jgi:hypothetical protein